MHTSRRKCQRYLTDEDEDGKPIKTKPSVHTKKFAKMYGEKLDKNADAGDYVKDFRKSDAPQFKGKSDKKIQKMAIMHI